MQGITLYFMDNAAEGIVSSLDELLNSGLWGAFFAVLVLYFFLRRFTATFIVALAIPFSLVITLGIMYFFEYVVESADHDGPNVVGGNACR